MFPAIRYDKRDNAAGDGMRIPGLCVKDLATIAVKTIQAVLGGKPNDPIIVLGNGIDVVVGQPILVGDVRKPQGVKPLADARSSPKKQ